MKRFALILAAVAVLGLAANQAFAKRAPSGPRGGRAAAKQGLHRQNAQFFQQARYGYGHHKYQYRPRGHHGPAVVYPRVPRHYGVVVTYPRPYYYAPWYYPAASRGFSYSGPGFSLGIGF